jgi:hypothetical protein
MRRSKWLGFVAAAFCALMLGVGTSGAIQSDNKDHRPAGGARQYGKVDNGTEQDARSKAETEQKNYNVPFSIFEVGSNNGKVDQYNKADTKSKSENSNKTWQDLQQSQNVKNEGNDCGCNDKGWGDGKDGNWGNGFDSRGGNCGCDEKGRGDKGQGSNGASQDGRVSNYTDQDAKSKAETEQKNYNVPIGLFQVGSNNGKVGQYNDANTDSSSSNWNKTSQGLKQDQNVENQGRGHKDDCGCEGDKGHGNDGAKQDGKVNNWTDQNAKSKAETEQTNVNVPIALFSVGSNNGNVNQNNNADTRSKAENGNETWQQADQNQNVSGKDGGSGGASQKGDVTNGTDQNAKSKAETKQVNVNAPISIFSVGSNNGDVNQGNNANTSSSSSNWNDTGQQSSQNQNT